MLEVELELELEFGGVGAGVRVEQGLGRVGVGIGVGVELGELGLEGHSLKLINAKLVKCERKFIYDIFVDCQIMEIGHCIDMRLKTNCRLV